VWGGDSGPFPTAPIDQAQQTASDHDGEPKVDDLAVAPVAQENRGEVTAQTHPNDESAKVVELPDRNES
jgi:hypothetical protein